MDTVLLILILLLIAAIAEGNLKRHEQLMRLLSDLATMIGDGIDAMIEKG